VKRLAGADAMMLYSETPNIHMHTLKVAVIDAANFQGEYGFELFRRKLRGRLHHLELLRYQLVDTPLKLHHPMWLENVDVDLGYHLRRVRVPSPGGRRELDEIIGKIASTPLDRSRPLWELHFVEGMPDHRFAVIGKVHHALADGLATANLMARLTDWQVSGQDEDPLNAPDPPPSRTELLRAAGRDHLQQIRKLPLLIKQTAGGVSRVRRWSRERDDEHLGLARNFHPPATFINHVVSPGRVFATATLALADFKETKNHLGVTINDLILATSAGALRDLLLRYDGCADEPIIASVPVSNDTSARRTAGNELGVMLVSLPVHISDPLERVRLTNLSTGIAKENYKLLGPNLFGRWSAFLPPALAPSVFRWLSRQNAQTKISNVPISNVPGPRERVTLAGAPMSEIYSVGPVGTGCGINITVWSYVDQLNISVIADDVTVNDPHEVTDAMIGAFTEIRRAAGLPAELTEVGSAMAQASAAD
jgi:diacylglycerol O-acyltransferase / wax synthase